MIFVLLQKKLKFNKFLKEKHLLKIIYSKSPQPKKYYRVTRTTDIQRNLVEYQWSYNTTSYPTIQQCTL